MDIDAVNHGIREKKINIWRLVIFTYIVLFLDFLMPGNKIIAMGILVMPFIYLDYEE